MKQGAKRKDDLAVEQVLCYAGLELWPAEEGIEEAGRTEGR